MYTIHTMEEYVCEKCNYKTKIISSYKKHLETELHKTGKRKQRKDKKKDEYKCDKCDYTTTNESNYKLHYLNNHGSKEERKKEFKYYCEKCDFGCFAEICFIRHNDTRKHKNKTN